MEMEMEVLEQDKVHHKNEVGNIGDRNAGMEQQETPEEVVVEEERWNRVDVVRK